jgi:hypothetical protein
VNEYVVAARPLDESIALGGVKPFHSTFFHLVPISCFIVCRAPARSANNFAGRTGPAAYGILSNGVSTVKHIFAPVGQALSPALSPANRPFESLFQRPAS